METTRARVALDGLFLYQPTTGSGQYSLQLWHHLATADADPAMLLLQPAGEAFPSPEPGAQTAVAPSWARSGKAHKLWWEQVGAPRAARRAGADLLHVPYFAGPRAGRLPFVTTIHDVIPLILPEYGGSLAMRVYMRLVSAAARRAVLVLTDSDCSKRDIERFVGIPAERIHVIPLAADPRYRPVDDPAAEAALRDRFGLPGPVIFNVDGLDVRKNLRALIEAFARALPALDPATRLVIAGRAHTDNQRLYPPLAPVAAACGVADRVVLTGAISEAEKLTLYNLADLYVAPSLYEGFGLSPLEAMACGTPVIASNRASLPEVVGDGGLLIEPTAERMGAAIVSVLTDEQRRRMLSQRARERAATFSWQRTAEQTRAVYREALAAIRARKRGEQRAG